MPMKDNNVIQFPVKPRVQHMQNKMEEKYYEEMIDHDNAVDMSHYLLDILMTALKEQEWVPAYSKMDFSNPDAVETKDMSIIINSIAAMLLRYKGYKHFLHDEMDYMGMMIQEVSAATPQSYDLDDDWDDE